MVESNSLTSTGNAQRPASSSSNAPSDGVKGDADLEPPIGGYSQRSTEPYTERHGRSTTRILRGKRSFIGGTTFYILSTFCFVFAFTLQSVNALLIPDPTPTTSFPTLTFNGANTFSKRQSSESAAASTCACTSEGTKHDATFAVEATMIPILVILSGILAGLTLGYMSLDQTQLSVLAKTGNPQQQKWAKAIMPIRKDGHLLLVTLLLANMIVNETLPVVTDGVIGGGVQAVVVSTVLIVIFSEIIPQSVCSRFGLQIGAYMVWPVRILIYAFFVVSWPVARLLNYLLGPHSGIVYRRAELKELINMHAETDKHGGDLNRDTITIVGATLDLQEKSVKDAMTPMSEVFSLPSDTKLDYETLGRVMKSGHSRVPVYEEISPGEDEKNLARKNGTEVEVKRRIRGVLLTKQLILLDPEDATPLVEVPLNKLPVVPADLPLLQILNTFQEGRSHMAVVAGRKPDFKRDAKSRAGRSGSVASSLRQSESSPNEKSGEHVQQDTRREKSLLRSLFHKEHEQVDGIVKEEKGEVQEQNMPTDARTPLTPAWPTGLAWGSKSSLTAMYLDEDQPLGIITLEDVLEELIGEEIYDETDANPEQLAGPAVAAYIPEEARDVISKSKAAVKKPTGRSQLVSAISSAVSRPSSGRPPTQSENVPSVSTPVGGALDEKIDTPADEKSPRTAPAPATTPAVASRPPATTIAGALNRLGMGMTRSRSAPGRRREAAEGGGRPQATSTTSSGAGAGNLPTISRDFAIPGVTQLSHSPMPSPSLMDTNVIKDESLSLITEKSGESGSEDEGNSIQGNGSELGEKLLDKPNRIRVRRHSMDESTAKRESPSRSGTAATTASPLPSAPLPPLLSEALLIERGRRALIQQGQDPSSLNLRAAGPGTRSIPPSGSITPRGEQAAPSFLVIPAPGSGTVVGPRRTFKSAGPLPPVPLRSTPSGRPSAGDNPEGQQGNQAAPASAVAEKDVTAKDERNE